MGRSLPDDAARLEPRRLRNRRPRAVLVAALGSTIRFLPIGSMKQIERVGISVVVHEEDAAATWRDGQTEEVAPGIEGVDGARVDLRSERCDLDRIPVVPVDGDQDAQIRETSSIRAHFAPFGNKV